MAALLIILSAKIALVASFGSIVPFWDQWDDEAVRTYRPYLDGSLSLDGLLIPHNEHRLVLTRLLNLTVLEVVGHWDPILQMLLNALLHCAALGVVLAMLLRGLPPRRAALFAGATALVFVIPYARENTLWGFQSQIYFLLLLSLLALWCMAAGRAWSPRWWLGVLLGVLAYFGMASGALVFLAAAALHAVQMLLRRRGGRAEAIGIAALLATGLLLIRWVPTVEGHAPLKADSLGGFLAMFGRNAGWPLNLGLPGAIIVSLPGAALAWRLWRERPMPADIRWLILLLILWAGLQAAAMAWARATGAPAPRYLDILALGLLANLAALLRLPWTWLRRAAPAWLAILALGAAVAAARLPRDLHRHHEWSVAHAEVISAFLRSGDPAVFEGRQGPQELPYPTADRLHGVLADPVLRRLLPPVSSGFPAPDRASRWLTDPRWGAAAQGARQAALASPPLLFGLALVLLAWWVRTNARRPRAGG
ncbi:hypothetical protein GCM10011504_01530 [Siccirubricoccus deserti]|nr:hypothetical protein GCM10011504_01530 [Siccirubricoccus deserti]